MKTFAMTLFVLLLSAGVAAAMMGGGASGSGMMNGGAMMGGGPSGYAGMNGMMNMQHMQNTDHQALHQRHHGQDAGTGQRHHQGSQPAQGTDGQPPADSTGAPAVGG